MCAMLGRRGEKELYDVCGCCTVCRRDMYSMYDDIINISI